MPCIKNAGNLVTFIQLLKWKERKKFHCELRGSFIMKITWITQTLT